MLIRTLGLCLVLLCGVPVHGQPLPKMHGPPDRGGLLYNASTTRWQDVAPVAVTAGRLTVGRQTYALTDLTAVRYERRRGGFRGYLRPPRVRHVLTLQYAGGYTVIELHKDVADLVANDLQAAGVAVERVDTSS